MAANEEARQRHLKKYGSMLFCPERETLCVFMEGMWGTGCERDLCIIDDPENQKLQRKIEENRQKQIEAERRHREEERTAAPIRDQRNLTKPYIQKEIDEIHQMEERSQEAYRNNDPKKGDELFSRARYRRGELRKYMTERGIDPQSI